MELQSEELKSSQLKPRQSKAITPMNTTLSITEMQQTSDHRVMRGTMRSRKVGNTAAIALLLPPSGTDEKHVVLELPAPDSASTATAPARNTVEEGYEAWKAGGRISLKSVNIMCGIGLFIFGWLLAAAWGSAGRKGGFAIIIGLIVGLQADAGPLVPVAYICLWIFLAIQVAGYQKRFREETLVALRGAEDRLLADAEDVASLMTKAAALRDLGQKAEAIPVYRQAVEVAPANAQAHHGLGGCLFDQRNYAEALEAFRAAVDCSGGPSPELVAYRANVASALKKLGRKAEAKAYARETKQIARTLRTK